MQENRTSVLYPPGTTFASSDAFFDSCRAALATRYGRAAVIYRNDAAGLAMFCPFRGYGPGKCRFKVYVTKNGGEWVLDEKRTEWTHSHDSAVVPPGVTSPTRKPKRATYGAAPTSDNENDEIVLRPPSGAPSVPAFGTRFPTFHALKIAVNLAIVPLTGYPLSRTNQFSCSMKCARSRWNYKHTPEGCCSFVLAVKHDTETDEFVLVKKGSHLVHNHEPAPELRRDKNWRPSVSDVDVHEALHPKVRQLERSPESGYDFSSQHTKKPRLRPPSPSTTSYAVSADSLALTSSSRPPPGHPTAFPYTASAPTGTLYSSPLPPPPLAPACASAAFSPTLESFLLAVHPATLPLAPHLLAAGVDSVEALVSLCGMGEDGVAMLSESLSAERREGGVSRRKEEERPSIIQIRLLMKALSAARDTGWA
ncbi:hypothetical protein JCM10207_007090 [Rhodosporidiobolus poonsookiae]